MFCFMVLGFLNCVVKSLFLKLNKFRFIGGLYFMEVFIINVFELLID